MGPSKKHEKRELAELENERTRKLGHDERALMTKERQEKYRAGIQARKEEQALIKGRSREADGKKSCA